MAVHREATFHIVSIFSTYFTGENRANASFLAVLQSLSLGRIERTLGALLEQPEFELVRFQNQRGGGGAGVPDAIVLSSCRLLIETKIAGNTVDAKQLKRHLAKLSRATESTCILLVLTPDQKRPAAFDKVNDRRLAWASFAALDQAVNELPADTREVVLLAHAGS